MTEEKSELDTWEQVIVDFLMGKRTAEEEKYIKDEIKKIADYYERQKYYNQLPIKDLFDSKKNKDQLTIDFLKKKRQEILLLNEKPEDIDYTKLAADYTKKCTDLADKYAANRWIAKAAKDVASVTFATHVAKLTHSKIKSPSLYDSVASVKSNVLTTSSLVNKVIDGAVAGNQYAPVFQFLELALKGNKLAAEFSNNNGQVLKPFAKNNEELEGWNASFKKALSGELPSSNPLAKQVYFPIELGNKGNVYHLLCHMKSSSLAHAIFHNLFDEQKKEPKELRKKARYTATETLSFIHCASISVTASNHSNASQLNAKRGGKLHLFSTQPPTWQSQLKPPLYKKSLFDSFSHPSINVDIDYLRDYLLRFERIELSIKNPQRLKWIEKWVANIIDELLNYAATLQMLPAGWSNTEHIQLKPEHQYLLDPYRLDEDFQNVRKAGEWQDVVCIDFSRWLNRRLVGKDKKFTPQVEHSRLWATLLEQPLREYNQMIAADSRLKDKVQA